MPRTSCPWVIVSRTHDATPMKIRFGDLQSDLASTCRYWSRAKQADGRFVNKLLTADEYAAAVSAVLPRQGTAEVLAQAGARGPQGPKGLGQKGG
eukprot:6219212-Pyramimonas_sp.AAC.1